jgi:DNA polymerase-3 subunit gamma/tau
MAQMLYRKWRPKRLADVVGQEHITRTLGNAVKFDRIAHAYLFCGPKGTGKTSTARILANLVNCVNPIDGETDGNCQICIAFANNPIDMIEIDAASNRGIDDIRDLREKIQFTPNLFKYKIYIVDEVHMLTEAAFNALLKILEEPPKHAIFILATTESQKVPETIVSRCQRYDFKTIAFDVVVKRLKDICTSENVDVSDEALALMTRYAGGSLRDAENLLEQAIVSFQTDLNENQIRTLLNLDSDEISIRIVDGLIDCDVKNTVLILNKSLENGSNPNQLQHSILDMGRAILLIKSGNVAALSFSENVKSQLLKIAEKVTLENIVKIIRVLAEYKADNKIPTNLALELVCVEAIIAIKQDDVMYGVDFVDKDDKAKVPLKTSAVDRDYKIDSEVKKDINNSPKLENINEVSNSDDENNKIESGAVVSNSEKWDELIKRLSKMKGKRFNIGALLRDCKKHEVADGKAMLEFTHRSHMERVESEIDDVIVKKMLAQTINEIFEGEYEIVIKLLESSSEVGTNSAKSTSHLVRSAQAIGALILEEKENTNDESENDETGSGISKKHDENSARD